MKFAVTSAQIEKILAEVAHRYATDQLVPLSGGNTNHVYSFSRAGRDYVVRWTPGDDQVCSRIEGEIAWLHDLYNSGVPVARVVQSPDAKTLEIIQVDDLSIYVLAFEKIEGQLCNDLPYTPAIAVKAGQALGKIHHITHHNSRGYSRPDWRTWHDKLMAAIPANQPGVLAKWQHRSRYLDGLPKDGYGLVHGDYQPINWFLSDEQIVVIDFDDSHYNWLIYDIARMVYFALWSEHPGQSNHEYADAILNSFVAGYRQENLLESFWIEQMPMFLKLVELTVYTTTYQIFGLDKGVDFSTIPVRFQKALTRYQHNIENDIPYLDSAHFPWADYD